jgi:hypothetical protein
MIQANIVHKEATMADDITKRMTKFIEPFRVTPGSKVTLGKDFDSAFRASIDKKKDGVGLLNDGIGLLAEYQLRLAAESACGVVVVLQALDAAGKDGTIRHVMSGVNPQGVRVESFKVRQTASAARTTFAATRSGSLRAARSASSTDLITKRYSSCGCTRRSSAASGCLTTITSGSTATTRLTSGSAT